MFVSPQTNVKEFFYGMLVKSWAYFTNRLLLRFDTAEKMGYVHCCLAQVIAIDTLVIFLALILCMIWPVL